MGIPNDCEQSSKSVVKPGWCKNRQKCSELEKNLHCDTRGREVRKSWPRIVFALLDYGVRRCRQLERRFRRFLSTYALSLSLCLYGRFLLFLHSVSLSEKWYSNDRARSRTILVSFAYLRLPSFYPDLKAALQRFVAFA